MHISFHGGNKCQPEDELPQCNHREGHELRRGERQKRTPHGGVGTLLRINELHQLNWGRNRLIQSLQSTPERGIWAKGGKKIYITATIP